MNCVVTNCSFEQSYITKGLCKRHYKRLWATGSLIPSRIIGDDVARFWDKVEKTDTCWIWQGVKDRNNYGIFHIGGVKGKSIGAHRYSYELNIGKIPAGLYIDHVKLRGCKSTLCVNPAHLEPVTNRENVVRGKRVTNKKSGLPLGVQRHRRRFRAYKMFDGVSRYLGSFDNPSQAHKAYVEAS